MHNHPFLTGPPTRPPACSPAPAGVPRVTTTAALAANHRPEATGMEAEVAALLAAAGAASGAAVAETEQALALRALSVEEARERQVGGWAGGGGGVSWSCQRLLLLRCCYQQSRSASLPMLERSAEPLSIPPALHCTAAGPAGQDAGAAFLPRGQGAAPEEDQEQGVPPQAEESGWVGRAGGRVGWNFWM